MTLIVTDGKYIYTDTMQVRPPIATTYTDNKVLRIDDNTIMAMAGICITPAELQFIRPALKDIDLNSEKAPSTADLNKLLSTTYNQIKLLQLDKQVSTTFLIFGKKYVVCLWMHEGKVVKLHRLEDIYNFNHPLSIGSGSGVFDTEFAISQDVIEAMKAAMYNICSCGGTIIRYPLEATTS